MKTTLLLDADIIAYKIASTAEKRYQFPGCEPSVMLQDWDEVTPRIDAEVNKLTKKLETSEVMVCLSCPTAENWRLDILPTYKGNRKGTVRPQYLQAVKDYLAAEYPSYRRPTLEADDIMGILSTHPTLIKGKKVIVSEDKDMKTIPGWLFNPAKDKAARLIDEHDADRWHLYQALCGDTTDGYVGCPGIGPVKAAAALLDTGRAAYWDSVVDVYESKGLTEDDALIQARVARICRASDFDFKTKKVIPWTPQT